MIQKRHLIQSWTSVVPVHLHFDYLRLSCMINHFLISIEKINLDFRIKIENSYFLIFSKITNQIEYYRLNLLKVWTSELPKLISNIIFKISTSSSSNAFEP